MKFLKKVFLTMFSVLLIVTPINAQEVEEVNFVIKFSPEWNLEGNVLSFKHPVYFDARNEVHPESYSYRLDVNGVTGEQIPYEPGTEIEYVIEDYEMHRLVISVFAHYNDDRPFKQQQLGQSRKNVRLEEPAEPEVPEEPEIPEEPVVPEEIETPREDPNVPKEEVPTKEEPIIPEDKPAVKEEPKEKVPDKETSKVDKTTVAVVSSLKTTEKNNEKPIIKTPNTGIDSNQLLYAGLVIAGLASILILKKTKNNI